MTYTIRFVHCFGCRLPVTPTGKPLGGAAAKQSAEGVARLCEMISAYKKQVMP